MSLATSRTMLLRHSRLIVRRPTVRHSSATSQAAEAATQGASKVSSTASSASSKASQGLSRVASSAGPAISGAARGLTTALGRIGGRTGRLIAFVESMIPPTIYYGKVGIELSKLVFQGQKMTPPPFATFQNYFQPLVNAARNPMNAFSHYSPNPHAMTPQHLLSQIRNVDRKTMVTSGVVVAELLGFFTVGEMIGRFKLVGYRGDVGEPHAGSTE
ncbi:MAG: hypothetical protein M1817_000371 [Caeruleum heppii]|nr:MAG: hypothetical protein M1817_000371 [Caeruleum heppii]